MKVIDIGNEKGGPGKTTLATILGAGLAYLGMRVLLIDVDPQGHVSTTFGLIDKFGRAREGVHDVLVKDESILDVMERVPSSKIPPRGGTELYVLPGGEDTQLAAYKIQLKGWDFGMLGRHLMECENDFDVVLVDTQPTPSLMTVSVIETADYVLMPTELARYSFDGLIKHTQILTNIAPLHQANIMGIVPMKVRLTLEHRDRLEELQTMFPGLVWADTKTSLATVWEEATDVQETILTYQPDSKAANQAWAIIRRVHQEIMREVIHEQ